MGAFHLAEQQRAGGGDDEVAEDRADQAVGGGVPVADEIGEGRDEGAEDDGQGQDRERALERGDAEDVEDLEQRPPPAAARSPPASPGGRCARRRGRRRISA